MDNRIGKGVLNELLEKVFMFTLSNGKEIVFYLRKDEEGNMFMIFNSKKTRVSMISYVCNMINFYTRTNKYTLSRDTFDNYIYISTSFALLRLIPVNDV